MFETFAIIYLETKMHIKVFGTEFIVIVDIAYASYIEFDLSAAEAGAPPTSTP